MALDAVPSPQGADGSIHAGVGETSRSSGSWSRWISFGLLAIVMALPWTGAWEHPLHTPDEGRYGSVSAGMAEHDDWIVPHFRGAPHLTKPPLIYWLQGGAIELLGRSEFALRLPSLVAASLACLVLFLFVRRMRGEAMAAIAVALYGVMPLPLAFGRLAVIDGVLNLFWISALACAALAVDARRRGLRRALAWLALGWLAVAFAALAKGPIAPAPMVIVAAWLLLGRRWRDFGWFAMHGVWGLSLALAPIGAWTAIIAKRYPEAWEVWRAQFIDRFAVGVPAQPLTSDDGGPSLAPTAAPSPTASDDVDEEPFWFYLPMFLIGMLPATSAMTLPWFNLRLREALRAFTGGDLRALMLVAVVGPLCFFSVARGKMPAYIVPVAAPMAILVAGMLARAVGVRPTQERLADAPLTIDKEPDVRLTFALVTIFGLIGAAIAGAIMSGASGLGEALVFIPVPIVACIAVVAWRRGVSGRRAALLLQWISMGLMLVLMIRLEQRMLIDHDMGARAMVERVRAATASDAPQFAVYAFRNPTVDYYSDADPLMLWSVSDLRGAWPKLRRDHAILVPEPTWKWIQLEYPRLAEALEPLFPETDGDADEPGGALWNRWPGKPTVILRMVHAPADDVDRAPGERTPAPEE